MWATCVEPGDIVVKLSGDMVVEAASHVQDTVGTSWVSQAFHSRLRATSLYIHGWCG